MNILPKKRWHVRTKENIARVRKDEAQAAEEARIEQERIDKAESEARLNLLRNESRKKNNTTASDYAKIKPSQDDVKSSSKHINFFEELEQGNIDYKKSNKDYEKDKKEEQEKYEKQIGLLTYLGQGIKEAVSKSWYNELPKRINNDPEEKIEVKPNRKALEDPVQDIKRYLNLMSAQKLCKNEKILVGKVKIEPDLLKIESDRLKLNNSEKDKSKKRKLDDEDDKQRNKRKKHLSSSDSSCDDDHKIRKKIKKHKSSEDDDSDDRKSKKSKKYKKHKKHKKEKKKKKKHKEIDRLMNNNSKVGSFGGVRISGSLTKEDLDKLRAERLEREKIERLRTQELLAEVKNQEANNKKPIVKQMYNSQFFPQLARQNCERN